MQIDAFLKLIEASRFATTIRDSIWMFPIIEAIHVISFTLVVGTIAVIKHPLAGTCFDAEDPSSGCPRTS